MRRSLILLAAATLALSGCARDMSSSTYSSDSSGGKVLEGTVVSARAVTIKDHDKLQDNTIGGLAGGAGGAVAGSSIGHGNGSVAGGIGGAIVGAVAGALIQDQLGTSQGMEYLVKIDAKYMHDNDNTIKKVTHVVHGRDSAEEDTKAGISTNTQSDIVSVVQAADTQLAAGTRVYIIYNDDRPRITPINPMPAPAPTPAPATAK